MAHYLFDVVDPRGMPVRLSESQYVHHILKRRPEFKDYELIRQTVTDPLLIAQNMDSPLSSLYYSFGLHPDYPDKWIKVVAHGSEIRTAHLTNKPRGRIDIVWQRLSTP